MSAEIDIIFSNLASVMLRGIMTHQELMNCYLMLSFPGYAKCQEYHYISEHVSFLKLCRYKVAQYGTLVKVPEVKPRRITPESWYYISKQDFRLDNNKRYEAMISLLGEWSLWEENANLLYKEAFHSLLEIGEKETAEFVRKFVEDTLEEMGFIREEKNRIRSKSGFSKTFVDEQLNWKIKYHMMLENISFL